MFKFIASALAVACLPLAAQHPPSMPGMPMPAAPATTAPFIASLLAHTGSGTSAEPDSVTAPMLMSTWRGWHLMAHGDAFITVQQQSGPRGGDKLFSTNWAMGMAQRPWGPGQLTFRAMLSLEPATITDRRYPEMFQTGETAFGRPIVDGQHPHNLFMELAALYDLRLGRDGLLTLYAAPVGDPAIGPMAFPHRASAAGDPIAPLGHHLEDSTHIAANVFTVAATYRFARLEGSVFHGGEPDENRWPPPTGAPDSYAWRATINPGANWSAQYSWARIKSPEALHPGEDQIRMTSSVMYNRPLAHGNWANTLLWGRTQAPGGGEVFNGYLAESDLHWRPHHVWTRIESVDKSRELLSEGSEQFLARVQAYSFGYAHDLPSPAWLTASLGAQWTLYHTPVSLRSAYGAHPQGVAAFLHLRLGR